jgi:branched-subunit amino acid aminotransferase/4-amino-4-deoxychorismate lyase
MARLRRSCQRLALADFDEAELLEALKALLRIDRRWLPSREGYSIYIRPFAFSSASTLGVQRPTRTTLLIAMAPVVRGRDGMRILCMATAWRPSVLSLTQNATTASHWSQRWAALAAHADA